VRAILLRALYHAGTHSVPYDWQVTSGKMRWRLSRNIELKARLTDPGAARRVAERLCVGEAEVQRQTDTYFDCARGRLKLREIEGVGAQLIWYERPDQAEPKGSDYLLTPIPEPGVLRQALASALGIRGVVRKTRRIYLLQNVRIHLDEVDGLGSFLEFEAVLDSQTDDAAGRRQVEELRRQFGIAAGDLLTGSYGDMLVRPEA
jgi:predicted adenylyl cyclase CyaB